MLFPRRMGSRTLIMSLVWRVFLFVPLFLLLLSCSGQEEEGRVGGPSLGLLRVIFAGDRFVAGEAGGAMLVSADGKAWSAVQTSPRQPVRALAWDGTRLLALGHGIVGRDVVLESTDGRAWRQRFLDRYEEFTDMVWTGSRFVAVGDQGAILLSDNAIDWWLATPGPVRDAFLTDLDLQNGRLLAVGWGGWVLSSDDDGESWSGQQLADQSALLEGVVSNGSRTVAVGFDGVIFVSDDGANWREVNSGTRQHLLGVAWGGERFVAVGFEGTIIESTDGLNWSPLASGTRRILTSVAWGNGRFAVVGRQSAVIAYAVGGVPVQGRIDAGNL